MSRYSSYAKLGTSCQTSLAVLTDTTKFYPLTDPDYQKMYTDMFLYPSHLTPNVAKKTTTEGYTATPFTSSATSFRCGSCKPR